MQGLETVGRGHRCLEVGGSRGQGPRWAVVLQKNKLEDEEEKEETKNMHH